MKTFIYAFLFLNLSAFSNEIKVGDYAVYRVFTGKVTSILKKKVISIEPSGIPNLKKVSFIETQSDLLGKEISNKTYTKFSDNLAFTDDLNEYCAIHQGTLEDIQVNAANFQACKLEHNFPSHEEKWIGSKIPFGVLKEIKHAGKSERIELNLIEFNGALIDIICEN